MTIRAAVPTDIRALVAAMQEVQALHHAAEPAMFRAELVPQGASMLFARLLASDSAVVLVAEAEGRLTGYVTFELLGASETFYSRRPPRAYLHHIWVARDQRRRGLGRALVESGIAALAARGVTGVGVDHWSFNTGSERFFAALGFRPIRVNRWRELAPAAPDTSRVAE